MTPVVSASLGASGPLLVKLGTLLANECGRLKGVRREIRSLKSELTCMHAALTKYAMIEDPDVQVKAWISLVRELAYDTEDVFDKFIHQLGNNQYHGGFKEFFRKTARQLKTLVSRRGIANQIDDLKTRIKKVQELKDSYKLNDAPPSTTGHLAVDPRLQAVFAEKAHIVGLEGPRNDLAKWMVEEGNNSNGCKVLSIVGFGGLGKTTLANEVYQKIKADFQCTAFVSVSQKPDIKKIIKDVISQVSRGDGSTKDTSDWDASKFIAKLRELLQDKRYLIFIDDVWSIQAWNIIKCAFPENNCSSRVIATTRIIDVAKACCPTTDDRMFEMKPLSDVNSRRLFFKRIFGSDDCCPNMLNEVSNEILKRCGGLPLAIISISALLANRPAMKEEWEKVKRSIGSALENNQSLEGMSSILSLSYNDLQPHLKTCLLYLSVFPEDYVIDRNRLVRRWISEGFISEERGQSQQDVAEKYFYELINKSMVQAVDIGDDGKVNACRVHDMMLEIIISKSVEDNFVTIVGGSQTSLTNHHGFIRRLSVQHIDEEAVSALANEDLSHVRSLTVTSSSCLKHFPCLVEFEALRVLDFEDCWDLEEYDMNNMDKLFQLKYLSLGSADKSKQPRRTMVIDGVIGLDPRETQTEVLPAGIERLTKLQYLITRGYHCKVPNGIGNMSSLRVISTFDITRSSVDAVEELGNLTRLNELHLWLDFGDRYKRHYEVLLSLLCKFSSCKLQFFHINGSKGSINFIDFWSPPPSSLQIFHMSGELLLSNIPRWISPGLKSLADLRLDLNELRGEDLHTLGELPSLVILSLCLETGVKEKLTVIGFPCLKRFLIFSLDGAYVTFTKGAMPKLEKHILSGDASVMNTQGFYLGFEHLSCLKEIEIRTWKDGATHQECDAAAAVIKKEARAHPNHPKFCYISSRHQMINDTDSDEEKSRDEGN
ncbi:hypothetical protein ACQJBY_035956 [Aegilops geniculata]